MPEILSQDPAVLGTRLKAARTSASITQERAAEAIGAIRTTIVGIEQGTRRLKPDELVKLADLYGISVRELLKQEEMRVELVPQFRRSLARTGGARGKVEWAAVRLLERLVANYLEIERLVGKPLVPNYPPEYRVTGKIAAEEAEAVAMAERARLGIGLAPIADIIGMLEAQLGLRIFTRPLDSSISGVFSYHAQAGGCMLINALHRAGRQALSGGHEYWHFLTNRQRPEVLHHGQDVGTVGDRAANLFAMAFLMPAVAVRQQFESSSTSGKFTPASLFYLAHVFHVSVEAMARRLEYLHLIRPHTWESLRDRGLKVDDVRRALKIAEPPSRTNAPLRLVALAVDAHLRGDLSEGELARLLVIDRLTVREWVDQFGGMAAEPRE